MGRNIDTTGDVSKVCENLECARKDDDLTARGKPGRQAAYRLCLAVGACVTHPGFRVVEHVREIAPELDGVLKHAIDNTADEIHRLVNESKNVESIIKSMVCVEETEDVAGGILRARCDIGITLAVLLDYQDEGRYPKLFKNLENEIESLDAELRSKIDIVRKYANKNYVACLRRIYASPKGIPTILPWWLE